MDLFAPIVLTSVVWVPGVLIFYWIIRLAVRHGMEDAHKAERTARRWEAVHAEARRQEAAISGSELE